MTAIRTIRRLATIAATNERRHESVGCPRALDTASAARTRADRVLDAAGPSARRALSAAWVDAYHATRNA